MYEDPAAWVEWAWWSGGWALVAVGVGAVLWALFRDRARGRLRCPACWYDMNGHRRDACATGLVCPECGHAVASERSLMRTRRHWRLACVGLVPVFLGTQVADWLNRRWEEGWTKYVPTTVLVLGAVMWDDARWDEEGLARDWWDAVRYRPMRDWQSALGEWCLLEIGPQERGGGGGVVVTRAVWPVGEPVVLEAGEGRWAVRTRFSEGWIEISSGGRTARADAGCDGECGCCCGDDEPVGPEERLVLAGRGEGKYVEPVTVRVKCCGWTIARWTVDVAFEVRGTLDDVVPSVTNAEVDAAVRRALYAEEYDVLEGVRYGLWMSPEEAGLEGEGFGWGPLKGDVLVDGKVVAHLGEDRTFRVVWADSPETGDGLVRVAWTGSEAPEDRDSNVRTAFAREHVTLRVTGDQRGALGDFAAEAYWGGRWRWR